MSASRLAIPLPKIQRCGYVSEYSAIETQVEVIEHDRQIQSSFRNRTGILMTSKDAIRPTACNVR